MKHVDIRAELESMLKFPLSEKVWEFLWEESYINGIEMGDYTIRDVAGVVRRLRETFGQSVPEPGDAPLMFDKETNTRKINSLGDRLRVISALLAHDAEQDPLVVAIRTSVLSSRLLEPEEVEDWIKRQADTDGKPTRLLNSVPLPPEAEVQQGIGIGLLVTDPPFVIHRERLVSGIRLQTLSYRVPEDHWQRVVPITVGGVLEKLRGVSEHLAKRYGWQEAQATVFILTGHIPVVSGIKTETLLRSLTATTRIRLTIDPTLTPREVAKHYRSIRQKVLGRRYRPLSEKHIQLALFFGMRSEEEPSVEQMAAWNKDFPEWGYTHLSNFHRDCRKAQKRLLAPDNQIGL